MTSSHLFSLSAVTALLLAAPSALAQDRDNDDDRARSEAARADDAGLPRVPADAPAARFGNRGQKAVSSDAGLSLANTSVSGVEESTTTLVLRPALDWFFYENVSLGGFVGVDYTSAPGGSSSVLSIGPRIGYNLPVAERLSVWPKAGIAIANTTVDNDGLDEESNTSAQLNLFVPVMFHPVQHFFLGLGPALDVDLSGDAKATTVAARLTLGGWI